ncbi:MFS transporter [Streptomyces sp. NPDC002588]|uniref:MFS transporter n=1 Tax=Streptomyces sp. NPDC002588 TaxID=3154419 RepID=UPI003320A860
MSLVTYRRPSAIGLSKVRSASRGSSRRFVLYSALVSFFLISLDGSAINVSLPAISKGIGGGMSGLQWVIDGYTLTFAAFMLSAGVFSDRLGAKRVYALGLAGFSIASAVCCMAPNLEALVAARMAQGLAAALMLPTSLALIRQAYDDQAERARAIAVWTAVGGVAIALGPVIGGAVTSAAGWRVIFLLNVPIGALGLALLSRIAPSPRRPAPVDIPSQLTFLLALVSVTEAVITMGHAGFTSPVPQLLLLSALAFGVFFVLQARRAQPMVPLRILRTRSVLVTIASGFAINAVFYGMVFALGLYFQQVNGYSPVLAGAVFLPMCAVDPVGNMVVMKLEARFGARFPLVVGQILMAVGAGLMLMIDGSTPAWATALLLLPLGFGAGLAVPPLTSTLLGGVPSELAATSAAVLNTCRQVGSCFAIALLGGLVSAPAGFLRGLHTGILAGVAVLAATAAITFLFLRRMPAPDAQPVSTVSAKADGAAQAVATQPVTAQAQTRKLGQDDLGLAS